ncbi:MAG: ATP-dependent RecD-like DNA helicase [Chlamydiia bacterium]|nr:ATP-dependent RecD-like DNA helicase [Chlamydiia bacterium]
MDQLFGFIERITYHNPENGFTVAKLKSPGKSDLVTIVGTFTTVQPGESVRCLGDWKSNPSHGKQFVVATIHTEAPSDLVGIKKYLESGLIRGIGPKFAKRIVDAFGKRTLEILDTQIEKLHSIEGIGKKRIERITTCWAEQKTIREVMLFLSCYEISPAYAGRIYKILGKNCIEKLQENPYSMAEHIPGIGFKKADEIADKMGFPQDASARIDAGILYTLREHANCGNTCIPEENLIQKAEELLRTSKEAIKDRMEQLLDQDRIRKEDARIFSTILYLCEQGIAHEVKRIVEGISPLRAIDTEKAITWAETKLHLKLATEQKKGVSAAISDKFLILTGGPGTGKSTIIRAILQVTHQLTKKIILAAPTGRAAKRMHEITHYPATTIHSLLEYSFKQKGFRRNKENPLDCDLIVIDEASMIDTYLMYHLLKAIPSSARLILVGDIHQLPSVGPGNVLRDMIASHKMPVISLTEIFRQAKGSAIITNAHKINQGEFPYLKHRKKSDFFFLEAESTEDVLQIILDLVTKRLPKTYPFDPIDQIQVLSPMKRGIIGITHLNERLQQKLNATPDPIFIAGNRFGVGDKVMQTRNNYNKEVYNGDIGRIKKINKQNQEVLITFDGKDVIYSFLELNEVVLAYATSIHKYQGSESPCVVIPIHTSHFMMLKRNLLYTGVTRGKKLVILVGTKQAVGMAVSSCECQERETGLLEALSKHNKEKISNFTTQPQFDFELADAQQFSLHSSCVKIPPHQISTNS